MTDFDSRAFKRFCEDVLSKLATFQTACKCDTRRQAGTVLGIGGPAVGKAIAALEATLREPLNGEPLIDHSGPLQVIPTEAGELFKAFIADVQSRSASFLSELEAMQRDFSVRLAMTRSAWLIYGPELKTAYQKIHPDAIVNYGNEFSSRDSVWDDIEKSILEKKVDFGVYSYPPSRHRHIPKGLVTHEMAEEEIVAVFPGRALRLPRGRQVTPRQLPLERIVHYRRSLRFDRTKTIEAYLGQHNLLDRYPDDWLLGVDTIAEVKDTLIRRGGISFLPWPEVEREHQSGDLRAYHLKPAMRPRIISLAYRPQTSRPAVKDFLKAVATLPKQRNFRP